MSALPNEPNTVWAQLEAHATANPEADSVVWWRLGEAPFRWSRIALVQRARQLSHGLRESGVKKGDVCAVIIRHHPEFYPVYLAISALGALPAVLAYPNPRLHPDKFRDGLIGMSARSGLDWVLTERDLEGLLRPVALREGSTIRDLLFPLEWPARCNDAFEAPNSNPDDPCLLQHSSGTTGLQKGVALSHRAVLEHVAHYGSALNLTTNDKVASWLPLYHDMGLIAAFHLPLLAGIPTIQIDPFEWVVAPSVMFEAISAERATLSWMPNFAFNLMADRIHDEDLDGLSLNSIRMLINCSEAIQARSHDIFARKFRKFGFNPDALAGCYAMAETTFAVSQTPPGSRAKSIVVDPSELSQGRVCAAIAGRECVSSGRVIPGCEVVVANLSGKVVKDDEVGDLIVRSVSLFSGYRNDRGRTAEVLKDGWYHTGDYGFMQKGEIYVIGRRKDIIIVAGKNLYPEDIEAVVSQTEGVTPGRVVAFGRLNEAMGTEDIFVVAESKLIDEHDLEKVKDGILADAMQMDVSVTRVLLVPPRWLIKSSSGKLSRSANRARAIEEFGL